MFSKTIITKLYKIILIVFQYSNLWNYGIWGSEDHIKHYKHSKPIKPLSNEYNKGCEGFD